MSFGRLGFGGGGGGPRGVSLSDYMELVFDTSLAAGTDVEVPLFGTVNVTVDWGDDSSDAYTTAGVKTHTYAGDGVYFVRITGALTGFGHQTAAATAARAQKLIGCSGWGNLGITNVSGAFRDASNLVSAPDHLPANVTNTSQMFRGCTNFDQSVSNFNTSSVTSMTQMFYGCTAFNQSVSNFNTSLVTSMEFMFYGCTNFNQSVANFNTSLVTDMGSMFYGCTNFNQSVANFNTAAVTAMGSMFRDCTAFNQPVSNFTTAAVVTMRYMFSGCKAFNQSVSNFNTSLVTNMSVMFYGCTAFNQSVSNFNTASVTNMGYMFYGCTNFNQSVSNFNTAAVTSMEFMFSGCTAMSGEGISTFSLAGLDSSSKLDYFALGTTFSTANYDAILIAWDAAKAGYRTDLAPNFGNSKYSAGAAATARASLVTHGWTITDGGAV